MKIDIGAHILPIGYKDALYKFVPAKFNLKNVIDTLPTMFDLLQKGKLKNHKLHSGDIALFASVGAGMNINAMLYKLL